MLQAGDEIRRTQRGNNNAYCQDNDISWVDWRLLRRHEGLHRFVQTLIAFRRAEPTVRQLNFLTGRSMRPDGLPDLAWFGAEGRPMDWGRDDRGLIAFLAAVPPQDLLAEPNHHLLMLFHAGTEPRQFTLPELARSFAWKLFLNTAAKSPDDIYPELDGPPPAPGGRMMLESRSLVCYVARDPAVAGK